MHLIASEWRDAPLDPADRALCEWAALLTSAPVQNTIDRLDHLRSLGLSDRAIHDAAQVASYFNYITRIAEGLGVEPETFIRRWGDSPSAPHEAPGPSGPVAGP